MKSTLERANHIEQKLKTARAAQSRRKKVILAVSSCAAAFLLMLSLVLFLPFPTQNIAKYKDSEYYSLICKLNEIRPRDNVYKNNFEVLTDSLGNFFQSFKGFGNVDAEAPSYDLTTQPEDVTNNQVKGVIEGDLFKRSSTAIYYLRYNRNDGSYELDVYPIAGLNTQKSATLCIAPEHETSFSAYAEQRELFLSADATRAVVLTPCYHKARGILYTALIGIDLTGETPTETERVYVSGNYVSSRLVNGELLLVSNFKVNKFDYDDERQYIPQVGALESCESVPMDSIMIPDGATATRYTVLASLDFFTLAVNDTASLLSYSEEVYVSESHIFATLSRSDATTVSCLSYGACLDLVGTVNVNGTLNDRYSMDECEGVLRVFTTTYKMTPYQIGDTWYQSSQRNASLYCYSLTDFALIASVENFAPAGESVKSARFQGNVAYVCTAIELTDPVFAFDLSDYNAITYTDTGTISGYSLYLTPFSNDTMVGVGYGSDAAILKIEVYEQGETEVISAAKTEIVNAQFSGKFKSYFIDKENGLVGLATRSYMTGECTYLLFRYDGYNLAIEQAIDLSHLEEVDEYTGKFWYSEAELSEVRATLIDGVFYVFTPNECITVEL